MKEKPSGLIHLYNSTINSLRGLKIAYKNETAFRQEIILALLLFPFSFFLANTLTEWLLLVFPLFIMIITELLNSSIESAVDRVGSEIHPLSGAAKDMASAAVFVSLVLILLVWTAFLLRYFNLFSF